MFNKARLILISLALITVTTFAAAFVTSFELLVISRVVAGIAAGGMIPIVFAFVGDLVPVAQRQVAMGRILFAIMTGNLLGALAAGAVADLFGWRAVFVVMSGLGLIVFAVSVPRLRGAGRSGGRFDLSTVGPNYRTIFRNPLAKICFGAVFLEAAVYVRPVPASCDAIVRRGRNAGFDCRHRSRRLRHWRRHLWSARLVLPRTPGRAMDDAHRRAADGPLPRLRCVAHALAGRVHQFHDPGPFVLPAARRHPDLCQRARAAKRAAPQWRCIHSFSFLDTRPARRFTASASQRSGSIRCC